MKRLLFRGVLVLLAAGAIGAVVVISGVVPVAASSGHWGITAWLLHFTMQRSVATHSMGIDAPPLDDERLVVMGAGHYETACKQCHGAPGLHRMPPITGAATPHPPHLPDRIGAYDDAELFWIVRHGVKFTGMPAWPADGRDDEVWGVVAFLRVLPELDAEGYRELVATDAVPDGTAPLFVVYQCARCHGIDGEGRADGAFPRLAGQKPEYLRRSLDAYAHGRRHSGIMEPVAVGISDEDRDAAVRWYASRPPLLPVGTPAAEPGASARGAEIAQSGIPARGVPACVACHGPSDGPHHEVYPHLAGQYAPYLEQQLHLFSRGVRGGTRFAPIMHEIADEHALRPDEMAAVASYYAGVMPH